jgi:hypothetical protein
MLVIAFRETVSSRRIVVLLLDMCRTLSVWAKLENLYQPEGGIFRKYHSVVFGLPLRLYPDLV